MPRKPPASNRKRPAAPAAPEAPVLPAAPKGITDPDLPADLVIVGRVGAAHGLTGEIRVTSETQPPGNIEVYRPWLLGDGNRFREVAVSAIRASRGAYLVRLEGVNDRDQAEALRGQRIAVPRSALPALEPEREYYWRDLIGLTVVNGAGRSLGRVLRLLETGAHDVLVIRSGDGPGETLIPFVAVYVEAVDLASGRIQVDWPEE